MISFAKRLLVVAALFTSTSALAAPEWRVSEVSGAVTVQRDGKALKARQNTKLRPGDVVVTGSKGRAVLVRGKEYVVVSPKAKIKVAEPKKAGAVTQFFQYMGNVLFKIEKKSTPHFGVKTPYLAAVVKGTTFNVSVTGENSSVQVTEGAVEVATSDDLEAALLTPGLIGIVDGDDLEDLVVVVGDRSPADAASAVVRGSPEFVRTPPKETRTNSNVLNTPLAGARSQTPSVRSNAPARASVSRASLAQPTQNSSTTSVSANGSVEGVSLASLNTDVGADANIASSLVDLDQGVSGGASDDLNGRIGSESNEELDVDAVLGPRDDGPGNSGNSNAGGNGNGNAFGLNNGEDEGDDELSVDAGSGDEDDDNFDDAPGNSGNSNADGNGNGNAFGLNNGEDDGDIDLGLGEDDESNDAPGNSGNSNAGGNGNGNGNNAGGNGNGNACDLGCAAKRTG